MAKSPLHSTYIGPNMHGQAFGAIAQGLLQKSTLWPLGDSTFQMTTSQHKSFSTFGVEKRRLQRENFLLLVGTAIVCGRFQAEGIDWLGSGFLCVSVAIKKVERSLSKVCSSPSNI